MRRGIRALSLLALLLLALPAVPAGDAAAATVKGVEFPAAVEVGGRETRLNGVGTRTKFLVRVYLGALYLTTPTADAAAAIAADEPKRVVMHFVHTRVDAGKVREGLREGFAASAGAGQPQLTERLARFSAWFDQEMLAGERIVFSYLPGRGTEVAVKEEVRGVIEGADFMRALWSVWLGEKPVDAGLKRGMLGK